MAKAKKTVSKAGASRLRSATTKRLKTSARKIMRPAAVPAPLRIGEFYKAFGGVFVGQFPGGAGKPDYNLFAPKDPAALAFKGAFGPAESIPGADSDIDGLANTLALAKVNSSIAKFALGLKVHGRKDFYVAAPREARMVAAVAPEAFGGKGYRWTSKQLRDWPDGAVVQDFSDGSQDDAHKSTLREVVLLRREPVR